MITFDTEFKVLSKENKSIPRKDGNGTFDFTEVKIETTDKKPTVLIARLATDDMNVNTGGVYNMKIGLTSALTSTGRVFNNFVIIAFQTVSQPEETPITPFEVDDELPF